MSIPAFFYFIFFLSDTIASSTLMSESNAPVIHGAAGKQYGDLSEVKYENRYDIRIGPIILERATNEVSDP